MMLSHSLVVIEGGEINSLSPVSSDILLSQLKWLNMFINKVFFMCRVVWLQATMMQIGLLYVCTAKEVSHFTFPFNHWNREIPIHAN